MNDIASRCHSREGGNPVLLLVSLSILGSDLKIIKGEYSIYDNTDSRLSCFLCLGSLDSRLRGNDRLKINSV